MSYVTVVCAHHDVPAFAETSIIPYPSFLTERFSFNCGNSLHSDWRVHATYYYRNVQGRELGRKETSHVVTLCVRRVLLPHTIAALSNSRMHSNSRMPEFHRNEKPQEWQYWQSPLPICIPPECTRFHRNHRNLAGICGALIRPP